MSDISEKLSAYLDGELSESECVVVEQKLQSDPQTAHEMERLIAANTKAKQLFDELLKQPVPFAIARSVKSAKGKKAEKNTHLPLWTTIAASLVAFALGGSLGYYVKHNSNPTRSKIASASWLYEIADYHAVYAKQKRHLVEVPATEADHIEKWLGKSTKVEFSIPDLGAFGFAFKGARLLVVAGKPVAQLLYTDIAGDVIALCFKKSAINQVSDEAAEPVFELNRIKGFDFVSWNKGTGTYTIVGTEGKPNLKEIAARAAGRV